MINYGYIGTPAGFKHRAKGSKSPVPENINSWEEELDLDNNIVFPLPDQDFFVLKKFKDKTGVLFFAFMLYRYVGGVLGGGARQGDFYGSFVFLYENQLTEGKIIVVALESLADELQKKCLRGDKFVANFDKETNFAHTSELDYLGKNLITINQNSRLSSPTKNFINTNTHNTNIEKVIDDFIDNKAYSNCTYLCVSASAEIEKLVKSKGKLQVIISEEKKEEDLRTMYETQIKGLKISLSDEQKTVTELQQKIADFEKKLDGKDSNFSNREIKAEVEKLKKTITEKDNDLAKLQEQHNNTVAELEKLKKPKSVSPIFDKITSCLKEVKINIPFISVILVLILLLVLFWWFVFGNDVATTKTVNQENNSHNSEIISQEGNIAQQAAEIERLVAASTKQAEEIKRLIADSTKQAEEIKKLVASGKTKTSDTKQEPVVVRVAIQEDNKSLTSIQDSVLKVHKAMADRDIKCVNGKVKIKRKGNNKEEILKKCDPSDLKIGDTLIFSYTKKIK